MRSITVLLLAAVGLAVAMPAPAPFPDGGTGNAPDCGTNQALCCDGDNEQEGTVIGSCIVCQFQVISFLENRLTERS